MAQTGGETSEGWKLLKGTECTGNVFDKLVVRDCGGNAFVVNNASCSNNAIRDARFLNNAKGGLKETDGKSGGITLTMDETPTPGAAPVNDHGAR